MEIIKGKEGDELVLVRVDGSTEPLYLVESRYLGGYYTVYSSYDYGKAEDFYNNHIQHLL